MRTRVVLPLLALGLLGCHEGRPPADPAYVSEITASRQHRLERLKAEDGWLTLVGLYWLAPGENTFGSGPDDDVVLPSEGIPAVAGTFTVRDDGTVVLHPSPTAGITIDGRPASDEPLLTDRSPNPTVMSLGPLRFYVIDRNGTLGVRVRDPQSTARKNFVGIEYFPIDPRFRVEATYEPYPEPHPVMVASAQGPDQRMLAPGLVHFTLLGRECTLEPFVSSPDDATFFFVFRDATSGTSTYGAGRFLDAAAPKTPKDSLVLDFNRATNPPCAFTPYATCPIAPPQNALPVAVEAGEMMRGGGHH